MIEARLRRRIGFDISVALSQLKEVLDRIDDQLGGITPLERPEIFRTVGGNFGGDSHRRERIRRVDPNEMIAPDSFEKRVELRLILVDQSRFEQQRTELRPGLVDL